MRQKRHLCQVTHFLVIFSIAAPLPPRLLTHEHVARFLEETWRSEFVSSLYYIVVYI